jgi:NDP-sugar pyrophosphorylase family protein
MGRKFLGRQRLTITLRPEILKIIDKLIDGRTIRNRSHAIEYWLTQALTPQLTKVLILAGGEGVNFRPLTYELPKALIPIKGKPLLEHTLDSLKKYGFTDIVISLGHLGNKIREYFGDGSRWGAHITYLEQTKGVHGTAQPVRQAQEVIGDHTFLLVYGDVLADIDLQDLLTFHANQHTAVTMALASVDKPTTWGVANLKGNQLISFTEKPLRATSTSHLVNAGIYVCAPEIFDNLSLKSERLEKDVFPKLANSGQLSGYAFSGYWYDVSTPEVYQKVLEQLSVS